MTNDEIVVKVLQLHERALQLISAQLGDQACLLVQRLERCHKCKVAAATVEHRELHAKMCDRCAAETVVTQGRTFVNNVVMEDDDGLNDVRATLMREEDWEDMVDAKRIRILNTYVDVIKSTESSLTMH